MGDKCASRRDRTTQFTQAECERCEMWGRERKAAQIHIPGFKLSLLVFNSFSLVKSGDLLCAWVRMRRRRWWWRYFMAHNVWGKDDNEFLARWKCENLKFEWKTLFFTLSLLPFFGVQITISQRVWKWCSDVNKRENGTYNIISHGCWKTAENSSWNWNVSLITCFVYFSSLPRRRLPQTHQWDSQLFVLHESTQLRVERVAGIPSVIGAENYDVNRQTLSHCEGGHDEFWHKTWLSFSHIFTSQPGEKKEFEPLPMILSCELCKKVQLFCLHQLTEIKRGDEKGETIWVWVYIPHRLSLKTFIEWKREEEEEKLPSGKMLKISFFFSSQCLSLPDFSVGRTHAHSAQWPRRTE